MKVNEDVYVMKRSLDFSRIYMQKIVTSERPHLLRCTVLYGRHGGVCAPKSGHVIGSTVSVTKVELLFTFSKQHRVFLLN